MECSRVHVGVGCLYQGGKTTETERSESKTKTESQPMTLTKRLREQNMTTTTETTLRDVRRHPSDPKSDRQRKRDEGRSTTEPFGAHCPRYFFQSHRAMFKINRDVQNTQFKCEFAWDLLYRKQLNFSRQSPTENSPRRRTNLR